MLHRKNTNARLAVSHTNLNTCMGVAPWAPLSGNEKWTCNDGRSRRDAHTRFVTLNMTEY